MKVVVCIKQVPDTAEVRIDPVTNTLIREGVPSILNPLDLHAIEAAVTVARKTQGEAIALSMGPPQAEAVVREAIAQGCQRGILLTDRVIQHLRDVDLVFCGKQAIDGDTAQVGPGIAAHLRWPQATYVRKIKELNDHHVVLEGLTDQGNESLRVRLPAVLTVLKDLNLPRLPTLVSQMQGRRCEIERWGAAELGLEEAMVGLQGSPTRVARIFAPPARAGGEVWDRAPQESAARLAKALLERRLVE
jgi:electron transfer flavoprotein beta subunit